MATKKTDVKTALHAPVSGEFVTVNGERQYVIRNVDRMSPFLVSVISNVDHWLFVSSTGGLTAGRVSPETALFPYVTVDKIHDSSLTTGCKTLLRVEIASKEYAWEPFNREHDRRYAIRRNLYKNILGNKLCFEEINDDLRLAFRYTWVTSDDFGFARQCELENFADRAVAVEMLDGLQNILPAGTPRFAQTNTSNLVDAYKWSELHEATGLGCFTLYSGITDRAEPSESLKANTVFCLGFENPTILISSKQLERFRSGVALEQETHKRGIRGAYFVCESFKLAPWAPQTPKSSRQWQLVADIEKSQSDVVTLRKALTQPGQVAEELAGSVDRGNDELARIMACADGFQATAEEVVAVHHYANVLFNVLRGGIFDDHYYVSTWDFACTISQFNKQVFQRHGKWLTCLGDKLPFNELLAIVKKRNDRQLERLCHEYLPIRFGRRHGDPSRPWNQFAIRLKDRDGNRLLSYEGNWRDIFQNWEALAFSFPEFVENIISKFVNASTVDGYNPYRINKEGIDWEVQEPDNPWSYIGYWGDHQIIYLQKLLELSSSFHPTRLAKLLHKPVFGYANVPYRIKPLDALLNDPKNTVDYDKALAEQIEERVARLGADGKLVLDANGDVYQVNLIEKLLVPLLSKLGNLVLDGGIWMNTQRPEWNDANNALVGQGLSMVTLYYLRRYVSFLRQLLAQESRKVTLSREVSDWLGDTTAALSEVAPQLGNGPVSDTRRFDSLVKLGVAASRYREVIYAKEVFSGTEQKDIANIVAMLDDALCAIDHCIENNRREDGLFHAYNLLELGPERIGLDSLYEMLEGQVAVLSAGAVAPEIAAEVVEALFDSDVYRPDQNSFMLYPDRRLSLFLEKNRVSTDSLSEIPLLGRMLNDGDDRIVVKDADGFVRFSADFTNVGVLNRLLDELESEYGDDVAAARKPLQSLYESVFDHQAFTGRSGSMFGFEGLGSIYWHMVSKLLLAVQENFFNALDKGSDEATCNRLGHLYYRVRKSIGFNKTPAEFGAFPSDPYSHTPKHSGARQPGMTGQVKEEVLTRFGELGIRIRSGVVHIQPALLRRREFAVAPRQFRYLAIDGSWQEIAVPASGLAFTWCQIPFVYSLNSDAGDAISVTRNDGNSTAHEGLILPADVSAELFSRNGRVRSVNVELNIDQLFGE